MRNVAKDRPFCSGLEPRSGPHGLCALLGQVERVVVEYRRREREAIPTRRVPGRDRRIGESWQRPFVRSAQGLRHVYATREPQRVDRLVCHWIREDANGRRDGTAKLSPDPR
eukprot:SAG11_NODE_2969_length_2803_cov_14.767012_3_plen_112_part_00